MKEKGHGFFRKSKGVLVCGIVLGTFGYFGVSTVSADEVETQSADVVVETTIDSGSVPETTETTVEAVSEYVEEQVVVSTVETTEAKVHVVENVETAPSTTVAVAEAGDASSSTSQDLTSTATSTATITLDDGYQSGYGTQGSFSISTSLPSAKVGDTVTYTFNNLPNVKLLDGSSISDVNGIVIGSIKVDYKALNGPQFTADDAAQSKMNLGMNVGTLKVIFSDAVNDLEDISYVISSKMAYETVVASPGAWEMVSDITSAGKVLASDTTNIEAVKTVVFGNFVEFDGVNSKYYNSADGKSDIQNVEVQIMSSDVDASGTLYTISDIKGFVIDTSKLSVGSTFYLNPKRSYATVETNQYNAFVNNLSRVKAVVKSVRSDSVVFEITENLNPGHYGWLMPVIYDSSLVQDGIVKVSAVSSASNGLAEKSFSVDVKETGASTSSSGVQRGVLIVEHVTDDGVVLLNENPVKNLVGTAYATAPKEFEGYVLTKTPSNASGQLVKGNTLVTYVYSQIRSNVKVKYVTIDGEILEDESVVLADAKLGTEYSTEEKDFEGYVLTEIPSNAKGTSQKEDILVIYVYEKLAEPIPESEPNRDPFKPKSEVPVAPTPETVESIPSVPASEAPKAQSVLPSTGEVTSALSVVGVGMLSLLGLVGFKKKKED